jgi:uncharacterized protein
LTLEDFFKDNPTVTLAFSGGVDSSYLLYAGMRCGAEMKVCFVKTAFQPEFELQDALRFAKQVGVEIAVLEKNILDDRRIILNSPRRCYFCKRAIFEALREHAFSDGAPLIIDGTNASDSAADRPGMQALSELSVRSPLKECGLTKDDIRRLSKEAGLRTWDKPAYSCLATRIPHGRVIEEELLRRVEKAEDALFALGFTDLRVRVFDEAARIQLPGNQMSRAVDKKDDIVKAVKPYFPVVLLDLEGRG